MMRAGNSGALPEGVRGAAKPPCQVVMAHFDLLPPELRAVMRDTVLDWNPISALASIRRGHSPREIIGQIEDFERAHCQGGA